jgi:ceramide glucosyltransferase
VIRPVCGIEPFSEATLASTFALDYQRYEILFCVASAKDPIISLLENLIAAHPRVKARLFIGDDRISANPKLNNVVKGWRAAKNGLIVMADSNVLMPPDYLRRVLASWRPDTGMVSAPPVGSHPLGFWAEVECAFLNTYQARWQYAADSVGMGFAQGKTLCCRRSDMEAAGGLAALAAEAAEDAACTKLVRAAGLRVRLVDPPFQQPLGPRSWNEIWSRQVRWARLRRDSFPAFYGLEIAAGAMLPLAAAVTVADAAGYSIALTAGGFLSVWYGAEALLASAAGWHLSLLYPLHAMVRDALLPVLWLNGWRGRGFVWRGSVMSVDDPRPAA